MYQRLHHLQYFIFPRQKSCRIDETARCAKEHHIDFGVRSIFQERKKNLHFYYITKKGQLTREKHIFSSSVVPNISVIFFLNQIHQHFVHMRQFFFQRNNSSFFTQEAMTGFTCCVENSCFFVSNLITNGVFDSIIRT